jgi:hypothetical protein
MLKSFVQMDLKPLSPMKAKLYRLQPYQQTSVINANNGSQKNSVDTKELTESCISGSAQNVSDPVKFKVTYEEQIRAHEVALDRIRLINGIPDHSSRFDKKLSFHEFVAQMAESICAEIIVAKYFGIENFDPADSQFKKTADVGSRIEVKWTKYDAGALIIGDSDRNSDIAVLVTGQSPTYSIKGWIPVAIAKNQRWRRRDQPTFWVEQYNLHPIENLRRSSHGEAALPVQN